jgi:hypothetical protein
MGQCYIPQSRLLGREDSAALIFEIPAFAGGVTFAMKVRLETINLPGMNLTDIAQGAVARKRLARVYVSSVF